MTIVTETCRSGAPGRGCPGTILYDLDERHHGTVEFCGTCDASHEWDAENGRWRVTVDLRLARLETD
jgi:hypothetical protein